MANKKENSKIILTAWNFFPKKKDSDLRIKFFLAKTKAVNAVSISAIMRLMACLLIVVHLSGCATILDGRGVDGCQTAKKAHERRELRAGYFALDVFLAAFLFPFPLMIDFYTEKIYKRCEEKKISCDSVCWEKYFAEMDLQHKNFCDTIIYK